MVWKRGDPYLPIQFLREPFRPLSCRMASQAQFGLSTDAVLIHQAHLFCSSSKEFNDAIQHVYFCVVEPARLTEVTS